jgi:hypothetical protein
MTNKHLELAKKYLEKEPIKGHPLLKEDAIKDKIDLQQLIDDLKDLILVLENEDELTSWEECNKG